MCICKGYGLLWIGYESGEPRDLALCTCRQGAFLRQQHERHPEWLRAVYRLSEGQQVGPIEAYQEQPIVEAMHPAPEPAFLAAGKAAKPKAKL